MRIHIEPFLPSDNLQEVFGKDGWNLESEANGNFFASHPQILDEGAARNRLNRLGLLTSASLRIEFQNLHN